MMMSCSTYSIKRRCLFGKISSVDPKFFEASDEQILSKFLCPVDTKIGKLVNKFINIVFSARTRLDKGENIDVGSFNIDPAQSDTEVSDDEVVI